MYAHIDELVDEINDVLYSDSRITIDRKRLHEATTIDVQSSGPPTKKEIEMLVMGDDEGTVPDDLIARYPTINALLEEQF